MKRPIENALGKLVLLALVWAIWTAVSHMQVEADRMNRTYTQHQ